MSHDLQEKLTRTRGVLQISARALVRALELPYGAEVTRITLDPAAGLIQVDYRAEVFLAEEFTAR